MSESLIASLANSIGYPQEVPAEAVSFDFLVDGDTISTEVDINGSGEERILLKNALTEDEEVAVRLATYATGRLLKENAVLAWDPEKHALILWEMVKCEGQGQERRAFESFCESVDWWRDRVKEDGASGDTANKFLIRP